MLREPVANGHRAGGDMKRGAMAIALEPYAFSRLALNVSSSQDELGQVPGLAMVKPRSASPCWGSRGQGQILSLASRNKAEWHFEMSL